MQCTQQFTEKPVYYERTSLCGVRWATWKFPPWAPRLLKAVETFRDSKILPCIPELLLYINWNFLWKLLSHSCDFFSCLLISSEFLVTQKFSESVYRQHDLGDLILFEQLFHTSERSLNGGQQLRLSLHSISYTNIYLFIYYVL